MSEKREAKAFFRLPYKDKDTNKLSHAIFKLLEFQRKRCQHLGKLLGIVKDQSSHLVYLKSTYA